MEKIIDFIDGGKHYNKAIIIEYKEYCVCDIQEVENELILHTDRVWFTLDNLPFTLTEEELNKLKGITE